MRSATRSARTILYVEDDRQHATLVLRSLEGIVGDVDVVHVEDGEAALRFVDTARGARRPVLVLLDLRLPKLGGLEVLEALKSDPDSAPIPVVILSTSNSPKDVVRAYERHANSYLVKPADLSMLERLLRELTTYWLTFNHPAPAGRP